MRKISTTSFADKHIHCSVETETIARLDDFYLVYVSFGNPAMPGGYKEVDVNCMGFADNVRPAPSGLAAADHSAFAEEWRRYWEEQGLGDYHFNPADVDRLNLLLHLAVLAAYDSKEFQPA